MIPFTYLFCPAPPPSEALMNMMAKGNIYMSWKVLPHFFFVSFSILRRLQEIKRLLQEIKLWYAVADVSWDKWLLQNIEESPLEALCRWHWSSKWKVSGLVANLSRTIPQCKHRGETNVTSMEQHGCSPENLHWHSWAWA